MVNILNTREEEGSQRRFKTIRVAAKSSLTIWLPPLLFQSALIAAVQLYNIQTCVIPVQVPLSLK
jgi:hypothetical protein